ncbi:hypothetical protein MMC12_003665 [Toensbergia leucococca]|nr:hypothetical protein [Toensbergia leucococca]
MKRPFEEGPQTCFGSGQEDNGSSARKRPKRGDKYIWPGHRELDFLTNEYGSKFNVDGATFGSVARYMWYMRAKTWRPNGNLACLIREARDEETAKPIGLPEWVDVRHSYTVPSPVSSARPVSHFFVIKGPCFDKSPIWSYRTLSDVNLSGTWPSRALGMVLTSTPPRVKSRTIVSCGSYTNAITRICSDTQKAVYLSRF